MSKPDDKPDLQELDLVESKREFIETFFKRGAEFTEELMRENEKLRFRVVQLEEERRSVASGGPVADKPNAAALRDRKSTRLNSSHSTLSRMPSSA